MMLWSAGGLLARELVAAAIVGGGFLAVFGIAELWRRRAAPPVEWTRKFVHLFGGLIAATFPWAFHYRWTVVGLAAVFLVIIWGTRRLGLLPSVHGVARRSEGGIFFPVAVLTVFLLGHDQPVFYLVAILALVVSDTFAALLGTSYGRQLYAVESDRRSLEGSAVFFLTTFLITHIPLLLMARLDPLLSILVSIQVAIIVTQFEAISLRGSDNLLVPLSTFYLLLKMTPRGVDHIAGQLLAQLVIITVIGLVAWRTRPLTFSGAMALMLFAYGAWGLGGPEWIVAPGMALVGFVAIRALFARDVPPASGQYQVVAIFYACIVAAGLFVTNNTLETLVPGAPEAFRLHDPLYVPYVGVVAAQLALIFIAQLQPFEPRRSVRWPVVAGSLAAALTLVVPLGLAFGEQGITGAGLALAAALPVGGTALYLIGRALPAWPVDPPWNVRLQAVSTALAALAVAAVELRRFDVI
jgi:dolichol kinase